MTDTQTPAEYARPDYCTDNHLVFVYLLRQTMNLYGARPYLIEEFPDLTKEQAGQIISYYLHMPREKHDLVQAAAGGQDAGDDGAGGGEAL